MSRILVTTPTGVIGLTAVRELKSAGADVVAGVAAGEPEAVKTLEAEGITTVSFDFADPASMEAALSGVEALLLLLPLDESMRLWGAHGVQAAKVSGVKHLVGCSCMGADANAHFRMGKVLGAVDADIEESGLDWTLLRPSTLMQDLLRYGDAVRETGKLSVPEGEGKTSFVDGRDVGRSAAKVLLDLERHKGKTYVLTGGEALGMDEVAETLSGVAGRTVEYVNADPEDAGMALEAMGIPEWNIHMILSVNRYARNGYTGFVTKGVEYLTDNPAGTFESFAAEFADTWK